MGTVVEIGSPAPYAGQRQEITLDDGLFGAVLATRFSTHEMKAALTVLRATLARGRPWTSMTYRRLAEVCRMDASDARKAVVKLQARRVLLATDDLFEGRQMGFNQHYAEWADGLVRKEGGSPVREGVTPSSMGESPSHEGGSPASQGDSPAGEGDNGASDQQVEPASPVPVEAAETLHVPAFDEFPADLRGDSANEPDASAVTHETGEFTLTSGCPEPAAAKMKERKYQREKTETCVVGVGEKQQQPPVAPRCGDAAFELSATAAASDSAQATPHCDTAVAGSRGSDVGSPSPAVSTHAGSDAPHPKRRRRTVANCDSAAFERFYSAYPRKRAPMAAMRAFAKISPDETLLATILAGLERAKRSVEWARDGGRYIPHPSTWLNGHCWENDMREAKYTPEEMRIVDLYNTTLAGVNGWPRLLTDVFLEKRAARIDEFLSLAPHPDTPKRYFEFCADRLNGGGPRCFDWLMSKDVFMRIRERKMPREVSSKPRFR